MRFFSGKKVVLFHVVGAFTPTCTVDHLPAYIDRQDEILAKGVDSIVCFSTNDAMVMQSWNEHVSSGRTHQVRVVSDGNGEVIRALGLELDASSLGMGARGKRFAMIVDDGVVSRLFVEDNPARGHSQRSRFHRTSPVLIASDQTQALPRQALHQK